jgi:hypothetical protein
MRGDNSLKAHHIQHEGSNQNLSKMPQESLPEKMRLALECLHKNLTAICSHLKSILLEIGVFLLFAYGLWYFLEGLMRVHP